MCGKLIPRYESCTKVRALKIAKIDRHEVDGSGIITPVEEGYAPFAVAYDYLRNYNPQVGGYYVVYPNGYRSYSDATVFEETFHPID